MKKLTLLLTLLSALGLHNAQAGELIVRNVVPLDTVVSTGADTTTFRAFATAGIRRGRYLCSPFFVVAQMKELGDSSALKIYWDYSLDTVAHGYILFDSTVTAVSTATATQTVNTFDTILVDGINALYYRVRYVGQAQNDKASGVTIDVRLIGKDCEN
jgi:hypothetical protein